MRRAQDQDLAIFELGKIFYKTDKYYEPEHLTLLMTGKYAGTLWQKKEEKANFYLLKGICELLFTKLGMNVEFKPVDNENNELHPCRSAYLYNGDEIIGFIGALHPQFAAACDLEDVYVCELDVSAALDAKWRSHTNRSTVIHSRTRYRSHRFPRGFCWGVGGDR